MKRTVAEHAERFDAVADEYDQDRGPEYRAFASLVIEHARAGLTGSSDVVLDLGCGTGAIGLALADEAGTVVGRDVSTGMLERAREKVADRGLSNVSFGEGRFRAPAYDGPADVVVSNFAMHHLADDAKREAIAVVADYEPRRFVLGDVMLFAEPDPDEPFYSPEVDDPATVGPLAEAFTVAGFAVTAVDRVHDQVGVLVGGRAPVEGEATGGGARA